MLPLLILVEGSSKMLQALLLRLPLNTLTMRSTSILPIESSASHLNCLAQLIILSSSTKALSNSHQPRLQSTVEEQQMPQLLLVVCDDYL